MSNQIHFVMGKGGTGKTTLSILLARHFQKKGEHSIIVECNGSEDIPHQFGQSSQGYLVQQLESDISCISITAEEAIKEYILQQIHSPKLYQLIFKNRLVQPLLEGAPGLHNAVHLGKIYDLAIQKKKDAYLFDHIIVDAPATGHGLRLLTAAETMMNLSKIGPLYESNRIVQEVVEERSNIFITSLPEELPALETKELCSQLPFNYQKKIQTIFCNRFDSDQSPKDLLLPASFQKDFPAHHQLTTQWVQDHQEQQYWSDWLKENISFPCINIPNLDSLYPPIELEGMFGE